MRTNFSLPKDSDCYTAGMANARWNIPGLFVFDDIFFELWDVAEEYFGGKAPVHSISGARNVRWNSGRVNKAFSNAGATKELYRGRLEAYKAYGVNCFYTFSNTLITEKELNDRECNEMLEAMVETGHDGDGVILSSELLSDYLHKKYPTLKQKVSVIKSDVERPKPGSRDAQWYNDLAKRYDIVVLQPDDNFIAEITDNLIEKDKFEFLVNEACVKNCQCRDLHYHDMSRVAISGNSDFTPLDKYKDIGGICQMVNYSHPDPTKRPKEASTRMKLDEVKELYDKGFNYFKLQGRIDPISLAYDMASFMYEDGITGKSIFSAMMQAIMGQAQ